MKTPQEILNIAAEDGLSAKPKIMIAIELALAEGRRSGLCSAMNAVLQLDAWENSAVDATRVISSLMGPRT